MSVGFRYSAIWREFGDADLLHAFFSTISYRLESNNWGSIYPYLQKNFYNDKLNPDETLKALDELKDIREKFAKLKPEDIIWDAEDLTKKPPNCFFDQLQASNLSECFIALNGKNIFDILTEVFEFCNKKGLSVKIQSSRDLVK